ncbi:aldehyde dehydrogenase family protein [Celerinatantimonas sp. YJH-8]|uniref:aldehyde dehydrogenase family protein n=1 Tax=Celerinatantimonas sp. YJH-8 TaxID=3228714 RepID=UPI0038C34870
MMNTSIHNQSVLINNQWFQGQGDLFDVINPMDRSLITRMPMASIAQVDAAVQAAKAAFIQWKKTPPATRSEYLSKIARAVEAHRERLIKLQQLNSAKPQMEAEMDVDDVIATFDYYADYLTQQPLQSNVALNNDQFSATLIKEPIGVTALIMPWNFPMVTTAWKLAPALAAGCCVVLKPSELTPLAEIALLQLIVTTGLPAGVVNLVCGQGNSVGEALINHPDIAKISFTGSKLVGEHIMQQAARDIKSVSLELGGKSSLIVLEDADLDLAATLACDGAFFNAGQMCSATSRVLVAESQSAALAAKIKQKMQTLEIGPLISKKQWQKVQRLVEQAQTPAQVISLSSPSMVRSFHYPATLITDITLSDPLWREEIFGPVLCLKTFSSDAEAIQLANDTEYGLVATIVGRNAEQTQQIAAELQSGTVWINSPQVIFPQTGWGGYKQSSLGRELGPWGLSAFQEIKHIVTPLLTQA